MNESMAFWLSGGMVVASRHCLYQARAYRVSGQFRLERIIDLLRIGLALAGLHHLTDQGVVLFLRCCCTSDLRPPLVLNCFVHEIHMQQALEATILEASMHTATANML